MTEMSNITQHSSKERALSTRACLLSYDDRRLDDVRQALGRLRRTRFPRFIGNHPRDFTKDILQQIRINDYVYTEKKDGLRVLAIVLRCLSSGKTVLILNDRKNLFLYIEEMAGGGHSQSDLHKKDQSTAPQLFQSGETLVDVLDCELCLTHNTSELPQNAALSLSMFDDCDRNQVSYTSLDSCTLFSFDVLMIGSQVHTRSPFHLRYELLTTVSGRLGRIIARFGLSLRSKGIHNTSELLVDKGVDHASEWEGLIFYHKLEPYYSRNENFLLRFKSADCLSVDLLVVKDKAPGCIKLLAWAGEDNHTEIDVLPSARIRNMPESQQVQIAEFQVQCTSSVRWHFVRWRPDRLKPNHFSRVRSILHEARYGTKNLYELREELQKML